MSNKMEIIVDKQDLILMIKSVNFSLAALEIELFPYVTFEIDTEKNKRSIKWNKRNLEDCQIGELFYLYKCILARMQVGSNEQ
jgi:hypothetical protein